MMRKLICVLLILFCVTTMFSFTACTDDKAEDSKTIHKIQSDDGVKKNIKLSNVLVEINRKFSISEDDMMKIEDKDSLELFYNILPDDVMQFAAQTTINTSTDISEIILVEAVDSEAADRIFHALDVRYNSQKDLCASYSAELLAIINKCSVARNGNYVSLIMSSDSAEITAYYNSFFE